MSDKYYELYNELVEIANEILPYYDVDKTKPYSVYIWSKEDDENPDDWGSNLFDIKANEIVFYDEKHIIIEEALPVISKIQSKLSEIEDEKDYLLTKERLKGFNPNKSISEEEVMKKYGITEKDLDAVPDEDIDFE